MIRIGVTNTVTQPGINSLTDKAPPFECLDLFEALGREWGHDAWMVGYSTIDPEGIEADLWPRINIPAVAQIEDQGWQVVTNCLVFDYDNNLNADLAELSDLGWKGPPHARPKIKWNAERLDFFSDQIESVRICFEAFDLAFPNVIYTTDNGARFIHVLSEAIPVHMTEGIVRGVIAKYEEAGLVIDEACCDWGHLFRLPRVLRDGQRTSESPYFRYHEQVKELLIPSGVTPVMKKHRDKFGTINVSQDPRPTPEEARLLRERDVNKGTIAKTEAEKTAKRILKGLESFPCMFEDRPLPTESGRDNTLMQFVGQVASFLFAYNVRNKVSLFSQEFVYALLFQPVEQLEPDTGTPDWLESLWSKVRRVWAREEAKYQAEVDAEQAVEQESQDKLTRILNRVKVWCNHPELHSGDPVAEASFLSGMLIACSPMTYYVMQESGYYSSWGVKAALLKSRIRKIGMEDLIPLTMMKDGKIERATSDDILTEYGLPIKTITAKTAVEGAIVQDLEDDNPTLVLPMFQRRRDLEPTFSKEADNWLRHLFYEDDYLDVCQWIGHALDFEAGPICALSLQGMPGCGKKMLARGLLECIKPPVAADGSDLVMRFNSKLMRTPFMVIDEGLPKKSAGIVDVADAFRRLVSGEQITVEPKGEAKIEINNPMRVLFTANNANVVHELTGHRDLTPEDQFALAQRIMHVAVQPTCGMWLAQKGGLDYTRGWIAGDAGQESEYVLAKHFMYLYENRGKAPGKRLLVEGNMNSKIIQEMRTQSGSAPDVIETIISTVEGVATNITGFAIFEGRLYVTTAGIMQAYRNTPDARKQLDHVKIAKVLRGLKSHGTDNSPRVRTMLNGQKLRARWWDIDVVMLMGKALEVGMKSYKLTQLVEYQHGPEHPLLAPAKELNSG